LAFDTIYAEGQRRYMETFGAYARQFIGDMERPDVDKITGLSPVISIEQKTTNRNPRSTVGTVTEVYDFLRLLFARIGEAYSYNTGKRMVKWSEEEIVENIFKRYKNKKISLLAPIVRGRKGHYRELFEDIRKKGYLKVRVDGEIKDIVPKMQVDRYVIHDIELVVDRLQVTDDLKARLSQSVQQTMKLGKDLLFVAPEQEESRKPATKKKGSSLFAEEEKPALYSKLLMCEDTGISYEEPSPNAFSFNSPYGACPVCKGLGTKHHINMDAIIADPSLSISEGGIAPLGVERDAWVYRQAQEAAKKNRISLTAPISKLTKKQLNIILFGNEEGQQEDLDFENMKFDPYAPFEGIINMLQRWFANPYSEAIREWSEDYMIVRPCDACNGARLRKESLWFKVNGRNISELSDMNLDNMAAWFDGIELMLDNKQRTIAKDILKEIRERV
ncbi:MAG: excinuclease ABC subunit UvrA, partial [Chitinophagaceae bacterium]|nr:excinuclease ABC subunit UvrA [Chitinophagaceae bacterium]